MSFLPSNLFYVCGQRYGRWEREMFLQPIENHSEFRKGIDAGSIDLLNQAVDTFSGAAFKFEKYYRHLEKRILVLDSQLKRKNESLEKSLKEKEEVKTHLNNILESFSTGVVVIDLKGKIIHFNRAAENITGLVSAEVMVEI